MIELNGVVKRYKNLHLRFKSMRFDAGITVLHGHNGSGKSTLLSIIAGLTNFEGDLKVKGRVGLLSEARALPGLVKVDDYLQTLALIETPPVALDTLYEHFCLSEHKHRLIAQLSNGMKQRVHLMSVFMMDCDIYVLDEPLNALDQNNISRLMLFIEQMNKTVIITTHQPLLIGKVKRLVCQ